MSWRWRFLACAAATSLAVAGPAVAGSSPIAAGGQIGTTGIGGDLQVQALPSFIVRLDGDWLSFSHGETYSGIHYDGRLKTTTGGLFADFHPGGSSFLVSAGAYMGERHIKITAQPGGAVTVGGAAFTPAQIGRLDGDVKFSRLEPFLGLGFDNTFSSNAAISWRLLAGVAFSDSPTVSLTSTGGSVSGTPAVQAALAQEQSTIAHDAKNFRYYPVVQLGLTHRF